MFLLVVLQIVIAVFAFMYTEEVATAARKGFETLWDSMINGSNEGTVSVNGIQKALRCCGKTGPINWTTALKPIPSSCCESGDTCSILTGNVFTDGCGDRLFELVNGSGMLIAWIALVFGALEVSKSKAL